MRKSRLSIALMTSLLGVCALTGCDPVEYSPEGNLITYTIGDDSTPHVLSAEDIFEEYYNDSDKYQSIFDAIKSIVIRNYFTIEETATLPDGTTEIKLGKSQMPEIEAEANKKVSSDEHDATTNANKNSTSYDKEFEEILKSKGVKTRDELLNKYLDEEKAKKFDENYYKYFLDEIKNGNGDIKASNGTDNFWNGYFNDMLPYHVSHILVNVGDSSETNYYNGTITEDNCDKLYEVVTRLQNGESFKSVAHDWSNDDNGDSSSKAMYGDLGIMDYNTSFVNEFKLGIYAVENFYGEGAKSTNKLANSNIDIPGTSTEGLESQFLSAVNKSFGITGTDIPTVDINVFKQLIDVKKQVKSPEPAKDEVMENSTLVYPRNIIYNKYLNRHSFAFITGTANESKFGTFDASTGYSIEGGTGIHTYDATNDADYPGLAGKSILSTVVAHKMRPIIMVRAGGSYQGIHFIVVDRSAFEDTDLNGVTKDEYYTTNKIPSDPTKINYFPSENGVFKKTYANFSTDSDSKVNSRIDSFISSIKSYDSDKLSKFIFKKYMTKEGIKISDASLQAALERWIDTTVDSKEESKVEAWETTWTDYIGTLRKQNSARNSLKSEACRIGFDKDLETTFTLGTLSDTSATESFVGYCKKIGMKDAEITTIFNDINNNWGSKIKTIADLYNLKGALCNDGKAHK